MLKFRSVRGMLRGSVGHLYSSLLEGTVVNSGFGKREVGPSILGAFFFWAVVVGTSSPAFLLPLAVSEYVGGAMTFPDMTDVPPA